MSKYNSKKITVNGMVFDSKKEAARYKELKALEKAGAIMGLKRQVKYLLIPAQYEPKMKLAERECAYYADFVYAEKGCIVVEDTKGIRTEDYKIKRKLMLYMHGIKIREV